MIWALFGTGIVVAVALLWLRRLEPDDPANDQPRGAGAKHRSARPASVSRSASDATSPSVSSPTSKGQRQQRRSPFAAVSISPGDNACKVVQGMTNIRHLESAAPRLPLEQCDADSCRCTFDNHEDRRQREEDDRRAGIGLKSELYGSSGEKERRRQHGRRRSDRS